MIIVIALIIREDKLGLTSVIREFGLQGECYETMLHFLRSTAYRTSDLRNVWIGFVAKNAPVMKIKGRAVLVGDGTKVNSEGKYMPGVKKLRQESEDSSKASYIFGRMYGAVGVLLQSRKTIFSLPLYITIQEGVGLIRKWILKHQKKGFKETSHVVQMIKTASHCARIFGKSIIVLDRLFFTVPMLKELKRKTENGCDLKFLSRAKSNCKAYKCPKNKKKRRGQPRKRGEKVKLMELFDNLEKFRKLVVKTYDSEKTVLCRSITLLWGQGLYEKLRFVLFVDDGRKVILVTNDFSLSNKEVIELYSNRFKIEVMFKDMKQFGAFFCHFWTKFLPELNRFQKKDERNPLESITDETQKRKICEALIATERFVLLSSISFGIVQLISLRFWWIKSDSLSYTRTVSDKRPSIFLLRRLIQKRIKSVSTKFSNFPITDFIQSYRKKKSS